MLSVKSQREKRKTNTISYVKAKKRNKTKQKLNSEKETRLRVIRDGGEGVRETEEGGHNIKTCSYKINTRDVMHGKTPANTGV